MSALLTWRTTHWSQWVILEMDKNASKYLRSFHWHIWASKFQFEQHFLGERAATWALSAAYLAFDWRWASIAVCKSRVRTWVQSCMSNYTDYSSLWRWMQYLPYFIFRIFQRQIYSWLECLFECQCWISAGVLNVTLSVKCYLECL